MKHLNFIYFLFFLIASCASTHPGNYASKISGTTDIPLKISAQTIDPDPATPFQLIEITLENESNDWVRIAGASLSLGDPTITKLSAVLGSDLTNWAEAMAAKQQKEEHNREMLQAGLAIAGAAAVVAGDVNDKPNLAVAGAGVLVGTTLWAASDAIAASKRRANGVDKIPDNHLYTPTSVPGKLFIRRWVLLNKPANVMINKLVFSLRTIEGASAFYEVIL